MGIWEKLNAYHMRQYKYNRKFRNSWNKRNKGYYKGFKRIYSKKRGRGRGRRGKGRMVSIQAFDKKGEPLHYKMQVQKKEFYFCKKYAKQIIAVKAQTSGKLQKKDYRKLLKLMVFKLICHQTYKNYRLHNNKERIRAVAKLGGVDLKGHSAGGQMRITDGNAKTPKSHKNMVGNIVHGLEHDASKAMHSVGGKSIFGTAETLAAMVV